MSCRRLLSRFLPVLVSIAIAAAALAGGGRQATLVYPAARCADQVDDYHGTPVADPYRWLEDVDSAETAAWVAAQNELAYGFLERIPQRARLVERLTELWNHERYSAPVRRGGRTFFLKNDGLQPQSVLYVQDGPDARPRVLLDPNTLSADGTVSLGGIELSKDGELLAWAESVSGSDWRTWFVRRVDDGVDLDDRVEWNKFTGVAWLPDGSGFYYGRYPVPQEGDTYEQSNTGVKIYLHRVGTSQEDDALVYERPDHPDWIFLPGVSDDGRYLILTILQGATRETRLYYTDLQDPRREVVRLLDDFDASYGFVGNDGPIFYVQTDLEAPRQRLVAIDVRRPGRANWRTLVPERNAPLTAAKILADRFVLVYLEDVTSRVRIHDKSGAFVRDVRLPGLGTVGGFHGEPQDTETYYVLTSFLNPSEIYHYDFETDESTLYRRPDIDFDFDAYVTEQLFFRSQDGTRVPMFVVHRKGLRRDGSHPTIATAYGGFNWSFTPYFDQGLLPWLEMGGIYAVVNIRGGGEYGEEWHQGGMLHNKQNGFDDFMAACEHLIAEGWTSTPKLCISGASNGGLLVAACLVQRPELFGAVLPDVAVTDMLRYHLWTIGWAWAPDYGRSDDPQMFPTLYAYSPYHNIRPGVRYPAVMITTADHDDRVVPGHSFKFAARLQAAQAGPAPVLARIQTRSGHGAGKPTAMQIQERADQYAFLCEVLGME